MHFSPTIIGSENIPKDGAVVIAGNHKNIRDQFLVFLATDRVINYMAKREYFDGALAPLFKWAGCIPVNRDGFDAAAVRRAIKILKRGGAVGIFPEGTRNRTDKSLLAFKPGAAAIAKRGGALIVPFAISGEYRKNGNLKILFGEPFSPKSGLQLGHGLGHRQVAGPGAELYAGKARKRFGTHADRADGIVIAAVIEHPVHAGRVAVPQKEGLVYVAFAGIGALLQNGRGVGLRVDGVFLFVVAALGNDGLRLYGRVGSGVLAASEPAHQEKGNTYAGQQHQAANNQHNVHFCPEIQPHFGF